MSNNCIGILCYYMNIFMDKDIILQILTFATRAPSTHNSQPWLFKLNQNGVSVFYDPKLKLPQADQEGRDLYISIGCMLENMRIASLHFGFDTHVEIAIDESTHQIAHIIFIPNNSLTSEQNEKFFAQIPKRVNARGQFSEQKMSNEIKNLIQETVSAFEIENITLNLLDKSEDIKRIAELTQEAMHVAYKNHDFRSEMSDWMNSNISTKKQGLPGYSLKMPLMISLIIPILIKYVDMGKFLGKLNLKSLGSAPLLVVLSGQNTKEKWITIGQCAERLMLALQAEGLQTSIYVGSIEMGDLYRGVQQLTKSSERPQFIFAVGYIPGTHKITPRHDIMAKIIQ